MATKREAAILEFAETHEHQIDTALMIAVEFWQNALTSHIRQGFGYIDPHTVLVAEQAEYWTAMRANWNLILEMED